MSSNCFFHELLANRFALVANDTIADEVSFKETESTGLFVNSFGADEDDFDFDDDDDGYENDDDFDDDDDFEEYYNGNVDEYSYDDDEYEDEESYDEDFDD